MSINTDSTGRFALTSEPCRRCHAPSQAMHPAGVVSGLWTCTRCGHRQNDPALDRTNNQVEED